MGGRNILPGSDLHRCRCCCCSADNQEALNGCLMGHGCAGWLVEQPENHPAERVSPSAVADLQTFALSPAGFWFLQSSSKTDVIWAETCQIFWPFWHAPNIHIPWGLHEMTCAVNKGRGAAGPWAGCSAHRLLSRVSPKICTPAPPSLARSLPLKALHFPNNTLQFHFDFWEGLGPFLPFPLTIGKKNVYFKHPRFGRVSLFQRCPCLLDLYITCQHPTAVQLQYHLVSIS